MVGWYDGDTGFLYGSDANVMWFKKHGYWKADLLHTSSQ